MQNLYLDEKWKKKINLKTFKVVFSLNIYALISVAYYFFCSFSLPINIRESDANEPGCEWFNGSGPTSVELWTSVVNALCVSINNPQNGIGLNK